MCSWWRRWASSVCVWERHSPGKNLKQGHTWGKYNIHCINLVMMTPEIQITKHNHCNVSQSESSDWSTKDQYQTRRISLYLFCLDYSVKQLSHKKHFILTVKCQTFCRCISNCTYFIFQFQHRDLSCFDVRGLPWKSSKAWNTIYFFIFVAPWNKYIFWCKTKWTCSAKHASGHC